MVEAKEGKVDVDFFKNMIQSKEETEYKAGLSGIGGYSYKVDHLSGWFINFFAYISKGTGNYYPFKDDHLSVLNFKKLPNQKLTVPFKIVDFNNKEHLMKYKVGFIGCNTNNKNEVYPVTGWIVSPKNKKEDDEDDENDENDDENLVKVISRDKDDDSDEEDEEDQRIDYYDF